MKNDATYDLFISYADADRACYIADRNLTRDEWNRFVGPDIPYECTCPGLPPGQGAPPDACKDTD